MRQIKVADVNDRREGMITEGTGLERSGAKIGVT
jgi:hypothetical protein